MGKEIIHMYEYMDQQHVQEQAVLYIGPSRFPQERSKSEKRDGDENRYLGHKREDKVWKWLKDDGKKEVKEWS